MTENFSFLDGWGGVYDGADPVKRNAPLKMRGRKPLPPKAAGGYRSSVNTPWILGALNKMATTRQAVLALTPNCEIAVDNASAVFHGYGSLRELYTACTAVCQGSAQKSVGAALSGNTTGLVSAQAMSGAAFAVTNKTIAASDTNTVFGWRVRITAAVTNFAYRPVRVQVGTVVASATALAAPTSPVLSFLVIPRKLPVDVIVLSVSNAAGYFTVVPGFINNSLGTTLSVQTICSPDTVDANTFVSFESLNARDLISRSTAANYDQENDFLEGYEGIRDEA